MGAIFKMLMLVCVAVFSATVVLADHTLIVVDDLGPSSDVVHATAFILAFGDELHVDSALLNSEVTKNDLVAGITVFISNGEFIIIDDAGPQYDRQLIDIVEYLEGRGLRFKGIKNIDNIVGDDLLVVIGQKEYEEPELFVESSEGVELDNESVEDEVLPEQVPVVIADPGDAPCKGCPSESDCISIGARQNGKYCNLDGSMLEYKNNGDACVSDFECRTNVCGKGFCSEPCSGCVSQGVCYERGHRTDWEFCASGGLFVPFKESGDSCENDFECENSRCAKNTCYQSNPFKRILSWFARVFG